MTRLSRAADAANGQRVGVAQLIGNMLAVSSLSDGRTTILTMLVNADGSLNGTWLRRTDPGSKGTETWKKL